MIVLVNGATDTFRRYLPTGRFGYLGTPRNCRPVDALAAGLDWGCDNDAYSCWSEYRFLRMVESVARVADRSRLRFVACPDVVADAAGTLARFARWRPLIVASGLPVGLVTQDGMTVDSVPWDDFAAIFVGGSTEWKTSPDSMRLALEARARGKWVHVGRVNSLRRVKIVRHWLDPDSIDGTCFSKWPDIKFPLGIRMAVNSSHKLIWD